MPTIQAFVSAVNISSATATFWDSILHSELLEPQIWTINGIISQWERYLVTDSNILIRQ